MRGKVLAIATFCAFWITPYARHHQHVSIKPAPIIEPINQEPEPSPHYDTQILILPAHIVDSLIESNIIPPSARLPSLPTLPNYMTQIPELPPLPLPPSSMLSLLPMLFPPMMPTEPLPRKPKKPRKKCSCPSAEHPVCGSDGLTYANECELKCGRKMGRDVQMARVGACEAVVEESSSSESLEEPAEVVQVVQEPGGLKEVSMEEDYSSESSSSSEEDYPDGLVFDEVPMAAGRNRLIVV